MIYILEFSQPLGNPFSPHGSARYYLGWCPDGTVHRRLREHRNGNGAAITRSAAERGIQINLVVTLPGDRTEERRLKNLKNTPRLVRQLKQKGYINGS